MRALPAVAAAAVLLAACGSSSSNPPSSSSGSGSSNSGSNARSASGTVVSTTSVSGYGTVLATASGQPLYMLTADPKGGSSCAGACAKQWPPLKATGKPSADSGVSGSLLSSFKRSDGTEQVLYNGYALYTHPGMSASSVAGTASDGGIWYLVSAKGRPVKSTDGGGY